MTWKEVLKHYQINLSSLYNTDEIRAIFFYLWERETGSNKINYYSIQDNSLEKKIYLKFSNYLEDLKQGKPLQYITNEAPFYGLSFYVNQHTLIPRPETEELVDWILNDLKSEIISANLSILDVGTGSGCIPISISHSLSKISEGVADIKGIDISTDALKVAHANASKVNVDVNFLELDILDEKSWNELGSFDIIISNPPYICPSEAEDMHQNVLNYEPHLALFVEGNDPLLFYRKISQFALIHLRPSGKLYFEINPKLEKEMVKLLTGLGFKSVEIKQDMQLKNRMIKSSK